jgi:hypothetical protein
MDTFKKNHSTLFNNITFFEHNLQDKSTKNLESLVSFFYYFDETLFKTCQKQNFFCEIYIPTCKATMNLVYCISFRALRGYCKCI